MPLSFKETATLVFIAIVAIWIITDWFRKGKGM